MIQSSRWHTYAPRVLVIPTVFALGAAAAIGLRGTAGSQPVNPPVHPSAQVLSMQDAFEQVADKLRPSVVFIKSQMTVKSPFILRQGQDDGQDLPFQFPNLPGMPGSPNNRQFRSMSQYPRHAEASGSGVIVRSDGYILTNDHVVEGADKVTVKLQDGREFVGHVKRDFRSDLALIKIAATDLPAAELADSDKVRIGQWAIAFGSPLGLSDTMTVGVVSALHREQEIGSGNDGRLYPSLLQTDASINPGNSGGPLVDVYGRVVGINVAIASTTGGSVGIGFAIPSNTARYIMDELMTKGSVTRGFLGLAPSTPTYDEQQRYGVKEGALVSSVSDGTPAARAGFQVEDVIVRYDGKPVHDDADLRDMVSRTKPGTTVPVVVKRGSGERTLDVTVGSAPDEQVAQTEAPTQQEEHSKLGVRVGDAGDAQLRQQLNLKGATTGAVVVEVVPGSPASNAGLQQGDVIVRLNGRSIANASQLTEVAHGLQNGSAVTAVIRRGSQTILAQIALE